MCLAIHGNCYSFKMLKYILEDTLSELILCLLASLLPPIITWTVWRGRYLAWIHDNSSKSRLCVVHITFMRICKALLLHFTNSSHPVIQNRYYIPWKEMFENLVKESPSPTPKHSFIILLRGRFSRYCSPSVSEELINSFRWIPFSLNHQGESV